jgi:hypothetical protein
MATKAEKSALARRALAVLQEKPEGMAGGLLNQKLKQSDLDLVTKVYGNGGDIQRGWLQDLMRKLPEVEQTPMGRDTWYKCSAEYLVGSPPSRCISDSSFSGSPGEDPSTRSTPEHVSMETPARTDLANSVRSLLTDAPGGMSPAALGLRLRRSDPGALEAFYEEADPDEPKQEQLLALVRSIPGVNTQQNGSSEFFSMDKLAAFPGLFRDSFSEPPPSRGRHRELDASPQDAFADAVKAFFSNICRRRAPPEPSF